MSLNLFNHQILRLRERIGEDLARIAGRQVPASEEVTETVPTHLADLPTSLLNAVNLSSLHTVPVEVVKLSTPPPAGPPRVFEYSPLILDDTGEIAPTSSYRVIAHDQHPIGHRLPAIGVSKFAGEGHMAAHIQISYSNFGQFIDWQELNHLMKYALPAGLRVSPAHMPDDIVTVIGRLPQQKEKIHE